MDDQYLDLWQQAVALARENHMFLTRDYRGIYKLRQWRPGKPLKLILLCRDFRRMMIEVGARCVSETEGRLLQDGYNGRAA